MEEQKDYVYLAVGPKIPSFKIALEHLEQFSRPSEFYQNLHKLVLAQIAFFDTLSENQKNDELYKRRMAELHFLEKLLESLQVLPEQLHQAQELTPKLTETTRDDQTTDITISISPRSLPKIYSKYYIDDTELYNLCKNIVAETETPLIEYISCFGENRNHFIAELKKLVSDVDNKKIIARINSLESKALTTQHNPSPIHKPKTASARNIDDRNMMFSPKKTQSLYKTIDYSVTRAPGISEIMGAFTSL